jgi:hypothetical protein
MMSEGGILGAAADLLIERLLVRIQTNLRGNRRLDIGTAVDIRGCCP